MAVSDFVEVLPGAWCPCALDARARTWRDYVTLTKPRIMSLLVLTAVCAMVAAAGARPRPCRWLRWSIGGALACGGASALNHVLDRDIDRLMGPRTASRPVAAGRISPARAAAFASGAARRSSFAVHGRVRQSAGRRSGARRRRVLRRRLHVWLKRTHGRRTSSSAAPPARSRRSRAGRRRTAHLGLGAGFLFLIVLLWTPPHFWALALLLERHYAAARGADDAGRARAAGDRPTRVLVLDRARRGRRCCRAWSARSGSCICAGAAIAGRSVRRARLAAVARRHRLPAPPCCSISRCCISRCCSSPSRSMRPCAESAAHRDDGQMGRASQRGPPRGSGAVRITRAR